MCCDTASWKREEVPDHKFDFINVREFHATGCGTRLSYFWLYTLVGKSFAVYIADVYTAIALLASNRWSGSILQSSAAKNGSSVLEVPFNIGKWIFTGCIIFSFLLLLWEARKSRAIIKSRDISYAFTNVMSQNWYSLRSYDHFCFFCQINNSKKKKDEFAFFIFFTFKGWKRLLLADAPRQVINAITLYSFGKSEGWTTDVSVYFGGSILKAGIIITMLFTLVIWVGSAVLLLVAAIMYIPLLCYIQGNLKEYCCHKVDKRIAELMKRKTRKRLAKEAEIARKEARGDFSHLMDKKTGKMTAAPLPQPTLPKVGLADVDLYSETGSIRGGQGGGGHQYPPQYPPSNGSYGGGAPQSQPWERKGVALYDRPLQPPAPSGLQRSAYPYVQSDPDSLNRPEYAESVSSLDGFAARGAPMGGAGYGYESQNGYSGGGGRGAPPLSRGLSNAPSYHSEDEKGGYGDSREKLGAFNDEYDARGGGQQYRSASPSPLQHMPSQSSLRQEYQAPPPDKRQMLLERTRQDSQSSMAYRGGGGGDRESMGDILNGYGGWEEQERVTVEQEQYRYYQQGPGQGRGGAPSQENLASRPGHGGRQESLGTSQWGGLG